MLDETILWDGNRDGAHVRPSGNVGTGPQHEFARGVKNTLARSGCRKKVYKKVTRSFAFLSIRYDTITLQEQVVDVIGNDHNVTHKGEAMNKKVLVAFAMSVGILGFGKSASAANFASAAVKVTLSGTLSMSIVGSTFTTLSSVAPGGSVIAVSSITVLNDSVGIVETFSLKSFDSTPWTLANTPGFNQFALQGIFNSVAPVAGDFNIPADSLTAADKVSAPGTFEGNQSGAAVPPGQSRGLWVRFQAPTSTTSFGSRDLTVSIVAGL